MRYSLRSPFEPGPPGRPRRFRAVPVRTLVPNIITLLALCAGLTAIRLAAEGTFEWAVYAIVFAAVLDGIDGRVARLLKGTSRFGAELDSLADFVNFGVAPGVTLYFWSLHEAKAAGWIGAMVFAIAAGLRLARFNVTIDDPNRPSWAANFFAGMPTKKLAAQEGRLGSSIVTLKRARRRPAAIANTMAPIQPAALASCRLQKYSVTPGATPKFTKSARLSSSAPKRDVPLRRRATRPSMPSSTAANTMA